jgi:DNA anti-recombination protein RmuC
MAKSNQADTQGPLAQLNKLDAIKEIIFGEEKQDLDLKLGKLEDKLSKETEDIRDNLQKEIKALNDSLSQQIAALGESLSNQLKEQDEAFKKEVSRIDHEKTNRADLGDLLIALGNQLKQ